MEGINTLHWRPLASVQLAMASIQTGGSTIGFFIKNSDIISPEFMSGYGIWSCGLKFAARFTLLLVGGSGS